MKNIAIIFGGKSVEHDISVITALQVMSNMPDGYKIYPIYILPNGEFVTAESLNDAKIYLNFTKNAKKMRKISFNLGKNEFFVIKNKKIRNVIKIDCALLCNHGHGGEDGSLQGLLELCDIPYTSPSVVSSAITMDKVLTKKILISEHIDTPAYVQFNSWQYQTNQEKIIDEIVQKLSFPCIVKPARLGSSVGINICSNEDVLKEAISYAFNFDDKIIVEKFIENAIEFCCAALKINDKIFPSNVEQVHNGNFYTFEEKYLSKQEQTSTTIEKKLKERIKTLTKKVYASLDLSGIVRIDFLYSPNDKKLYVNEPNSIPGSLAFNMFNEKFSSLLELVIENAISDHKKRCGISYSFSSEAIKNFIQNSDVRKMTK